MTPEQKADVRRLIATGARPCDVARRLCLSRGAVTSYAWRLRNPRHRPEAPPRNHKSAYPFSTRVDLDARMLAAIDARAKADRSSRAEAIRTLIEWGLEAE